MRGKARVLLRWRFATGITPAYAGKRASELIVAKTLGDHPRLCGEKTSSGFDSVTAVGSPPPMRGKVTVQSDAVDHGGITPAYAGKRDMPAPQSVST